MILLNMFDAKKPSFRPVENEIYLVKMSKGSRSDGFEFLNLIQYQNGLWHSMDDHEIQPDIGDVLVDIVWAIPVSQLMQLKLPEGN